MRPVDIRTAQMDWLFTLSGFIVGTIVGFTGVGGGSLMTPLLVLLFGVHPSTAVGTDLLYAAVTKSGGTLVHARQGQVRWDIVGRLAAGSIPATALTLTILAQLPKQGPAAAHLISIGLGLALLGTAAAILLRKQIQALGQKRSQPQGESTTLRHLTPITVAVGALLGVLVSLSSVGAGALGTAALFFLYPRLPTPQIVGSDVAHAVPLTLVAGIGHWLIGSVDFHLLGTLLLGSLPGIWLGCTLSARVPERVLRPLLAGTLVLVGTKLIAA